MSVVVIFLALSIKVTVAVKVAPTQQYHDEGKVSRFAARLDTEKKPSDHRKKPR